MSELMQQMAHLHATIAQMCPNLPATETNHRKPAAIWVIDTPGRYQMDYDLLITQGCGILITASDVLLNLENYSIRFQGEASKQTGSCAIRILNSCRVSVQNGTIEGFDIGIYCDQVDYLRLQNMHLLSPQSIGVYLHGNHGQITDCRIMGAEVTPEEPHTGTTIGIHIAGRHTLITGNEIYNAICRQASLSHPYGIAILLADQTQRCVIIDNHMQNNPEQLAHGFGIWLGKQCSAEIHANVIANVLIGIASVASEAVITGNQLHNPERQAQVWKKIAAILDPTRGICLFAHPEQSLPVIRGNSIANFDVGLFAPESEQIENTIRAEKLAANPTQIASTAPPIRPSEKKTKPQPPQI